MVSPTLFNRVAEWVTAHLGAPEQQRRAAMDEIAEEMGKRFTDYGWVQRRAVGTGHCVYGMFAVDETVLERVAKDALEMPR